MIKLSRSRTLLTAALTLSLALFLGSCGGKKSSKSQGGLITDKDAAKKKIDSLASKEAEKLMAIADGCIAGTNKEKFMAGFLASSAVMVSADLTDKVDENVAKVVGVDKEKFDGLDKVCSEVGAKLATALIQSNEEVMSAIGTACAEGGDKVTLEGIATKLSETKAMQGRLSMEQIKTALTSAGYGDDKAVASCKANPKTGEAAAGAKAAKASTETDPNCP
jgi:hypothetical protein